MAMSDSEQSLLDLLSVICLNKKQIMSARWGSAPSHMHTKLFDLVSGVVIVRTC